MQEQDGGTGGGDKGSGRFRGEETIGEILLAAREDKGLTIEELSRETKIPARMLEYLETDNFEAVPARVYVKGFLRTYAGMLGLDVEHIISKYEVQSGQTHTSKGDRWEIEADVTEEELRSPMIFKRFVLPVILVIIVIVIIFRIGYRKERVAESPAPLTEMKEGARQKLDTARTPEPDRKEGGDRDRGMGAAGDAQTQARSDTEPSQGVSALLESSKVPPERASGPSEGTREPPGDVIIETTETPSADVPLNLRLTANSTDSTWFNLVTLSTAGDRQQGTVYDFILLPGQSKTFRATDAFVFRRVDNAGGFTMELNGRRLPPLGKKGEIISNVRITLENLSRN